jgi:hypothetical protein
MTKNKRNRAKARKKSTFVSLSNIGFSGWAIIFLSVAILTFVGSMVFNQSEAFRSQPPITSVTLQLLNGCGVNGACEKMANALLPGEDGLLYDIIEKADAEFFGFEKTLVVDRGGDSSGEVSEKARIIASRLDIAEDDILRIGLADNLLDIDVTVIAGSDFMEIVEKLEKAKEENL